MTGRQQGMSLVEVLIAASILTVLTLSIVETQLYLQRERVLSQQQVTVLQELSSRLEAERLANPPEVTVPDAISSTAHTAAIPGLIFSRHKSAVVTELGIAGVYIEHQATWSGPHGDNQSLQLGAWILVK